MDTGTGADSACQLPLGVELAGPSTSSEPGITIASLPPTPLPTSTISETPASTVCSCNCSELLERIKALEDRLNMKTPISTPQRTPSGTPRGTLGASPSALAKIPRHQGRSAQKEERVFSQQQSLDGKFVFLVSPSSQFLLLVTQHWYLVGT